MAYYTYDSLDSELISELRQDGRATISDLAKNSKSRVLLSKQIGQTNP